MTKQMGMMRLNETEADEVIICQGPPACLLKDDAAVAEQTAGCRLCRRILIYSDGTEIEQKPIIH